MQVESTDLYVQDGDRVTLVALYPHSAGALIPWLWHLLSVEAVEALKGKALGWPIDYVKERWRELLDDRERVMVRSRRIGPGRRLGSPVTEPETTFSRRYWRTVADY